MVKRCGKPLVHNKVLMFGIPLLCIMQDYITLKVKVRAFPSKGRVRIDENAFSELQLKEGDGLLLSKFPAASDDKSKPLSVAAYHDKHVQKGYIMLSPEDIAALGVAEGDTLTVKRKVPLKESLGKKTSDTGGAVKKGAVQAGTAVKGGAKKAGSAISKGASDVAGKVKPKKPEKES
jgi:hypothetical protein